MCRGCSTASAVNIDKPFAHEFLCRFCECLRCLVIAAHHVWQTCIWAHAYRTWSYLCKSLQPRLQLTRTKGTVQTYAYQIAMCERSHVCLYRLTRERSSRSIGKSTTRHDRNLYASLFFHIHHSLDSSLCVESIEDSLNKDYISTSVYQAVHAVGIGLNEVLESHVAGSRIIHICRHRGCLVRRTHRTSHYCPLSTLFFTFCCYACSCLRNLIHLILQAIVGK